MLTNPLSAVRTNLAWLQPICLVAMLGGLLFACAFAVAAKPVERRTVSLDGTWQIAEGSASNRPTVFDHTVPVPGLVDMAQPPFVKPGPKVAKRQPGPQKDPLRDAFWYRRTFTVEGTVPEVATLKIGKAMFGTRVILNDQLLGDHAPCFTPGFFDAKAALKTGQNELLIRVGADRDAVTAAVPTGFDFEKERYIPGIFDSVELILSGTPPIENVQVAPDITNRQAKIRVYLDGAKATPVEIEIREAKSGRLAGRVSAQVDVGVKELDAVVPVKNCRLWSPEDPFLYQVTARTSGDEFVSCFGMREFYFDLVTHRAMLNGKPYFMRGSNITLYRFFEDSERGALPWNDVWVRKLHRRVKDMHWNCLRYCIGFPPEAWYRIADEEGILLQDEFPIWFGPAIQNWPKELKAAELVKEYGEWLRERWNHPSVVVWDASNETTSDQTAPAIQQVRQLDRSGRPWDNSYMPQLEAGDVFETHPYHFMDAEFKPAGLAAANPIPQDQGHHNDGTHAVIINEYGWLWLNRNGTPTTLTAELYANNLGSNASPQQRFSMQATWLAADTEFWRAHRQAAAVMHFTTLGYSRADGQTSDHWQVHGVAGLEWESEFYHYVRDAFAPVGLMVDFWKEQVVAQAAEHVSVILINDLEPAWSGTITLTLEKSGTAAPVMQFKQIGSVKSFGLATNEFDFVWPQLTGQYTLEAEIRGIDGRPVRSVRTVAVKASQPSVPIK